MIETRGVGRAREGRNMQTKPNPPSSLLAKLLSRLRGDRYMVDAYPPPAEAPEPVEATKER
jgi:hypothetical protein